MNRKSSYSSSFSKDLKALQQTVDVAAERAVSTASDYRLVQMSFDEAEIIPNTVRKTGTIVVTVADSNTAALDEILNEMSANVAETLRQDFINNMKGAI